MTKLAIICPRAIDDLGYQLRVGENQFLIFQSDRRFCCSHGVELPPERHRLRMFEACPYRANVNQFLALPRGQEKACNRARHLRDGSYPTTTKLSLDAFDLDPITRAAGSIRAIIIFGDDAFQTKFACGAE